VLAGEGLAQRADEGDAAGDGSLEQQVDPGRVRRPEELRCGVGHELLVAR
jgi:hypothetical protein